MKQLLQLFMGLISLFFAHPLQAQCFLPLSESNTSNHEIVGINTGQSFVSDCIATVEQITVTSGAVADIPNVTLRVWEERVTGTTVTFIQNNITIKGQNVPTQIDLTTLITPKPLIIPPGYSNIIKYYFTLESNNSVDLKLKAFDDAVNFQLAAGTAVTGTLATYSTTVDLIFNITTSSAILPVQYMSLTGVKTDDKVLIQWETRDENQNKHFEIQRLVKDNDFITIGVQSLAMSDYAATKSYQFVDNTPAKGLNYYRLKQVGLDGKVAYSKTISVLNNSKSGISVFPNPVTDKLRIQADKNNIVGLKVYHINGQLMHAQTLATDKIDIDVSNYAKGIYVVEAHMNNEKHVTKFVKN